MISVLFVDDEPALLEITRLFLERSGEIRVDTCRSALEALEMLKNTRYDAIVSDYEMPMMDGIVFLKILRAQGDQTPFLIFTGKGREHVVVEALNNRADFYLSKGQDPKEQFAELGRMIHQVINRRAAEEALRIADRQMVDIINHLPDATFAIDREERIISWNKAMEELTGVPAAEMIGKGNYEYALPLYGARRPTLVNLITLPDDEICGLSYGNIRRDGSSLTAESHNALRKGKPAILWARATLIYDRKGNLLGALESVRDITEIQQAAGEHADQEERRPDNGIFDRIFGKSLASWYKRGVDLCYRQGRFDDAIACFDHVIEMEPGHFEAWRDKGVCQKELGRYRESLECFDRALEIGPGSDAAWYGRGEALEKLGKETCDDSLFRQAIECFDRVLELDPGSVNAWNYRGICYEDLGMEEEARDSFEKARRVLAAGGGRAAR